MRKVGTVVGIMAMDITQSIGLIGVNIFKVIGCIQGRNRGFKDCRLRECEIYHGIDTRQFRTMMGSMTNNITQSTPGGGYGLEAKEEQCFSGQTCL